MALNDNPQISAAELADAIAAELIFVRDSMILTDKEKVQVRAAYSLLSGQIGNALIRLSDLRARGR